MGADSALMFRQPLCQNEIDILANLSLSGFRNGQLHTGADGYARDYLPVILIQKTSFLMIRFKLLFRLISLSPLQAPALSERHRPKR